MNTNHLKKFAQEARRKLLEQVGAKLSFVLTTDSAELREKTEQLKQLREELTRTTKEQLIEKVAYTWFNRLIALRFMDTNDYQPLGVRIITPKDGYIIPELLDEAKRGNIHDELKINRQKIYDLLDSKIPSSNPQNEAYKELMIATCNHMHTTFPFLFEKINDYTELLLPDDLTSDFSIVKDVRDGMLIDDCKNVEIIGWLYQFYISEKKDEVFASKTKVKKEDIPAATQLFTPRWIVEYMVQNTLGKFWLQNRPKSRLREHMPYFIESASVTADDYLEITSPEEIKLADIASGSGHILVYAFDLFTKIYEEEGYNTSDIPKLIIEKNLYGFEIDERAAQLSGLALMMKAREYQRRAFRMDLKPNILCYKDLLIGTDEIKETLNSIKVKISDELLHDLVQMCQATNYGSLINPKTKHSEIESVYKRLIQSNSNADIFLKGRIDDILSALSQLFRLATKFQCVVANPPYMGDGNMNSQLAAFVKKNYPDSKSDLMACFMESGFAMLQQKGFLGMINQHSWMFLKSYEALRKKLIDTFHFDTFLHLGARTFPEIGGEVVQNASFTCWKDIPRKNGIYIRLVDYKSSEEKRIKTLDTISNPNCGLLFRINQEKFKIISGNPFGYWLNERMLEIFKEISLSLIAKPKMGMRTGNNEKFLKQWFEVNSTDIGKKWIIYKKGGNYRKWYGNIDYVVFWENDGYKIKEETISKYPTLTWEKLGWKISNEDFYFKKGVEFSRIGSGDIGARYINDDGIFDTAVCCLFNDDNLFYILGLLNSTVSSQILKVISPTLTFQPSDVGKLPYKIEEKEKETVNDLVKSNVELSKEDWDSHELSLEFRKNILIDIKNNESLELEYVFDLYQEIWKSNYFKLHGNEKQLNNIFIDVYNLQGEISPYIPFEDITILQDELDRKKLVNLNKKFNDNAKPQRLQNHHDITMPFISKEIIVQYISYSIGCIFGRYSVEKEGLIIANQGESLNVYLKKINKSRNDCSFHPDDDNIIPILDDEWFEDDVVGRFNEFLKVTFGEKNFNKNIDFIEEHLGKDIRKYFIKDFYPEHIKRFKKRPIYWMFSSPKGSFNALIYLHRYTPDVVSNILNKYLKEFIGKLNTRQEHLERIKETGSPSDISKAIKESDNINRILVELREYERDILYPLATERIEIDLDDGVLVNYNKFGKAVKEINGLNDKKTKEKVRKFDWIDTTKIR